ncbi:hypothetical protein RESH_02927 [Rhodopirellula europaea SH398]|uniref:Uncharacterized protein n=2 Tax=Rhodopirellula europaea TaxID=1263866 RepID=M5SFG3_9BACT|nr:hypothetical protein RE6C_04678 [Rhodopirellula europaea 6C]EMI26427.1 hypothetical protein RESH_02927 [Rhodopirellula europaea SH398]
MFTTEAIIDCNHAETGLATVPSAFATEDSGGSAIGLFNAVLVE